MRNMFLTTSLLALATGVLSGQLALAPQAAAQTVGDDLAVTLEGWGYDSLYTDAWSIEELMDEAEVHGETGEEIGSVENVIIGADSEILAIIAQVGGFLDIGDTHVSVPWEDVARAGQQVTIPVNEENVEDFSVFGDSGFYYEEAAEGVTVVDDDLETATGIFKATDLIGDYAYLSGSERYGYVNDLLVRDGEVVSVVIDAGYYGTPGYRAYPYNAFGTGYVGPYGRGYGVNDWRYNLPYSAEDVTIIDTFEYDMLKNSIGMSGENPEG